jgi:hypothetical protein
MPCPFLTEEIMPCPSFRTFLAWDMTGVVLAPFCQTLSFFRGHLSGSGGMHASASHPIYLQCRWQLKFDLSLFGSDISQRMHHIIHVDWKQDKKSIDLRQRESISSCVSDQNLFLFVAIIA